MSEHTGTFVVTHAETESAVVRDVETAQVHTLSSNPGLETRDVLAATLAPEPPLEVAWQVVDVEERRRVELIDSDLAPTQRSRALASEIDVGEIDRVERAGRGEVHVLAVPKTAVETVASDVLEDLETVARAARLDAVRVEVRRALADDHGVVSVRYLPD
ncbi:DUF5812 family protein [Natronobiforma cellulositropha]|uniref:DUF5812 family protein n=1 Tax=Natronobiforma cellulositropha TaxID=1679076 RepID=UPI0021D58E4B|nr:DUF5812 family protein [Natronobiforma cellulositropha]